jgi:hypothetical protein
MLGLSALLGSVLPNCWVTTTAKDRQDNNAPRFRPEVDAVWKPFGCDATDTFVNNGIEFWLLGNEGNAPINLRDELDAEVRTLCLIPCCCLNEL